MVNTAHLQCVVFPTPERWPHLCWPMCCCCTAFPSVGLTARGKCAVWADSSGSEASSAPSGWWCSPESGRWSCWPKTSKFQRDKLATWVGGWKNSASNAADLQYDTVQYPNIASSVSRNKLQWRVFGLFSCSFTEISLTRWLNVLRGNDNLDTNIEDVPFKLMASSQQWEI